jgi:hypothetical protein
MSPRRESDRHANPASLPWLTLLPLFVAIVATATLVITS